MKFPKNAIAASALTHAAETVAFMCVGCMMGVYRHPSAVAVLNRTIAAAGIVHSAEFSQFLLK